MKDLSELPKARSGRTGLLPDAEPRFIQCLVEAWARDLDDNKPTALGTPFRHSDAGGCGRAITYTAAGIPASDPMDLSGVWNVGLGQRLHDLWQAELLARYPGAEVEVKVATIGADGSGHIDAVIRQVYTCVEDDDHPKEWVTAYELKSIGGWGYKASIGLAKGPAEGPKTSHLLQSSLNGLGVDADEVVIGYLAKEAVSKAIADNKNLSELERFCCEWTFTREQYEPLARDEAKRIDGLLGLVKDGTLGRRNVPHEMKPAAEIQDPTTGAWTIERDGTTHAAGKYWGCSYCRFQSICVRTGPGRIPVAEAVAVAVALGLTPGEAA